MHWLITYYYLVLLLHTFNGSLSGTTQVIWYQKGKTNLDFTEARDNEWQWHQLGHMQVCASLQTDNHTSTPPLSFYRPDALPAAQPIASKHWRQYYYLLLRLDLVFVRWTDGRISAGTTVRGASTSTPASVIRVSTADSAPSAAADCRRGGCVAPPDVGGDDDAGRTGEGADESGGGRGDGSDGNEGVGWGSEGVDEERKVEERRGDEEEGIVDAEDGAIR